MKKWFVYIVECSDKTYYTGISTDVDKRIETHNKGMGAKYTKYKLPVTCIYRQEYENHSEASKEEYRIKQLTKNEKKLLIYNKK